ncbi:MAG: multicopper oxidase domain-containing protein [Acidimicrobiia bacterium]
MAKQIRLVGTAMLTGLLLTLSACGDDGGSSSSAMEAHDASSATEAHGDHDHTEATEAHGDHDHGDATDAADEPTPTSAAATPAVLAADKSANIKVTVGSDDFATSKGTRVVSVPKGTSVTIELTDPAADQTYHLHGYDIETDAKKGETAKIAFTASESGQFDLESHNTNDVLLVLVVGS